MMNSGMIELYHGSNVAVHDPKILMPGRTLDFGRGFYMTSSFEQAEKWAKYKQRFSESEAAVVSVFAVQGGFLNNEHLRIKNFEKADEEWLDFVMANRTQEGYFYDYDIVKGAVANDRVYASINAYENGFMDKITLLKELRTWVYVDQIVFHTERSLNILHFSREVIV